MRAHQHNDRLLAALWAAAVIASATFCQTAYASRGIRTDFPSLGFVESFTGTSFNWAVPNAGGAFNLSFAPGTSLTNGCEWEGSAGSEDVPSNYDVVYMFNWFPNNGIPCTDQSQGAVQEQVLIYELENGSGQYGFNVGFAVDFNYPGGDCSAETATFTENTPFYGDYSYAQSNPCANSADFPNNDSFVLSGLTLTQSTTWGFSSVPEPGTVALLVFGLFGLSWRLARRRSQLEE